ncbi:exported hypothetical protein [Candidatus Zixiibacteriota bacterium]|nr:exported hypothetical protein [candidate division Zixibacteria bacterium]
MATHRRKISLLLSLIAIIILSPQPRAAEHQAFNQGHRLLLNKKYSEAYRYFKDLYDSGTDSAAAPLFLYYGGKAAYYAGNLEQSAGQFNLLIARYQESPYLPYAFYFLGNVRYRQAFESAAIQAYLSAYSLSDDSRLDSLLLKSLETAISNAPVGIYEKVNLTSIPERKKCDLELALARGLKTAKNYQAVLSLLASCTSPEAARLKASVEQSLRQTAEIGIVLPLSGELQKFGESILDGAMLRAGQYTRETGKNLTPIVYDTRGESVEAARIVRRLAARGVNAVIGPLTSEETAVTSAALSCSDMPLIIPAAGQGGLTDLSLTSFQLQPTLDRQGIKMAEFAFQRLKIDTVAVITPTLPENLRMAEAFIDRFKALGGTILGVEYFRLRETDFGGIINDLKNLSFGGKLSDSAVYVNENGDTLESKEMPARIDAIYIPAEAPQLHQLLPQINFYNVRATYLGGDGWADSTIYFMGRDIIKTCYFTTAMIANENNTTFRKFNSAFFDRYGQSAGHLEALGYDAMSLICDGLETGAFSRSALVHYLININGFHGAAGDVLFGDDRENTIMPIYTIENGKPKRADQ